MLFMSHRVQVTIVYCKSCGRYLVPPKQWIRAELESKELLTFCIKRIKGLQKVKLIDASFIWTEPHSKRIKVFPPSTTDHRRNSLPGSYVSRPCNLMTINC